MKTVEDLVEFLLEQDQSTPVQIVYDGSEQSLNIFEHKNRLCFSESNITPEYDDADVLFKSEIERRPKL